MPVLALLQNYSTFFRDGSGLLGPQVGIVPKSHHQPQESAPNDSKAYAQYQKAKAAADAASAEGAAKKD